MVNKFNSKNFDHLIMDKTCFIFIFFILLSFLLIRLLFSNSFRFSFFFFFFNDTATTEIYTLSLHDALPISRWRGRSPCRDASPRAPEPPWPPTSPRSRYGSRPVRPRSTPDRRRTPLPR